MKVGDLVTYDTDNSGKLAGMVVDFIEKKVWDADKLGKAVNWDIAPTLPHAVLLIGEKYITVPTNRLKVLSE